MESATQRDGSLEFAASTRPARLFCVSLAIICNLTFCVALYAYANRQTLSLFHEAARREGHRMRLQRFSSAHSDLSQLKVSDTRTAPDLVLYFGSRFAIASEEPFARLKTAFPDATIVGCSTGGQIRADELIDDGIEAIAISFESTKTRLASEILSSVEESRQCGRLIGERLGSTDLAGILVLADGLNVNGSDLVAGITSVIGPNIPLVGGLAGDGSEFVETLVGADCTPRSKLVAAIGFYGDAVRFGHGSAGGWDVFGSWRTITDSAE